MVKSITLDPSRVSVTRSMVMLASGALLGLLIAGYGLFTAKNTRSRGVPAEAVALVNQRPILRSDFLTQAQAEHSLPFEQISAQQRQQTLTNMLNEELLVQRGLEIDLASYDPEVRNALAAGVELEVTANVLAEQPTDTQLRAYFALHERRYSSEGVMRLRDLVLKSDAGSSQDTARAEVDAAVRALRRGEPLEAVMGRFNLVDSGRFMDAGHVDVGDIYEFAVHAKVAPALERAILPLSGGEISDPVVQDDGMHVVVMLQHRFPVPQTFEQAANRAWLDLKAEAQEKVRVANLKYLRGRAEITVAPDYQR